MTIVSIETTHFINELDAAIEAHMGWVRRVLRCAVLRTSPGDDVLNPLAHTLCHFGNWFALNKPLFEKFNAQNAQRLEVAHQHMHDAVRAICTELLAGRGGNSTDLDVFEQTQSELAQLLAAFKKQALDGLAEPFPWALQWSEQLSVNIPEIDAEHQHFIQLCNEFHEAIALEKGLAEIKKCMQAILDDAGSHFYHEETLLKKWNYPLTEAHAEIHAQTLVELSSVIKNAVGRRESDWIETGLKVKRILIEHILNEDMKFRDFTKKH